MNSLLSIHGQVASQDVLATVLEEMPPFAERESSILAILKRKKPNMTEGIQASAKENIRAAQVSFCTAFDFRSALKDELSRDSNSNLLLGHFAGCSTSETERHRLGDGRPPGTRR